MLTAEIDETAAAGAVALTAFNGAALGLTAFGAAALAGDGSLALVSFLGVLFCACVWQAHISHDG